MFCERLFQQTVGIPMGTNCADLFIHSCKVYSIQGLPRKDKKKLAQFSNFMYRYIDDVISLNNSMLDNCVHRIYLIVFAIKDTTYTARSASYLELYLEIDTEGRLRMKPYYCNYPIVNFPFICNNIQSAPVYGVYISQLTQCHDFLDRKLELLIQEFLVVRLKSSLRQFYGRHHHLVHRYGIALFQMTTDMFRLS
jgi:hypothetical protein